MTINELNLETAKARSEAARRRMMLATSADEYHAAKAEYSRMERYIESIIEDLVA